jgi:hypothetical protein
MKMTKVYKGPGYPVDPKLDAARIRARRWQFLEHTEYMDGRETTLIVDWAKVRELRQRAGEEAMRGTGGLFKLD